MCTTACSALLGCPSGLQRGYPLWLAISRPSVLPRQSSMTAASSPTPPRSMLHRQSSKTAANAPTPRSSTGPRLQQKRQRLTMGHQLVEPLEQQRKQLVCQQLRRLTMGQ